MGKTIAFIKELQAVCKKYNGCINLEKSEWQSDEYTIVSFGSYDEDNSNDIEAGLGEIDEDSLQTVIERKEKK